MIQNNRPSGFRYGNKSKNPYEQNRRAKRVGISIEELLFSEQEEQDKLDKGLKYCKSCGEWTLNFGKGTAYCRSCCAIRTRSNYNSLKQRNYILKKNFDITIEDYNKLLFNQENRCYICHRHQKDLDRALAVDHCHETGKVRGLLCGNCNRFLGQIKDDIETAKRLLEYLTRSQNI